MGQPDVTTTPSLEALDQELATYNLASVETGGNGNCQYCAVANVLQQNGIDKDHTVVRQEVANELDIHRDLYVEFVVTPYPAFLERTRTDTEWGDHVTLQAACNVYNMSLLVFRPNHQIVDMPPTRTTTQTSSSCASSLPSPPSPPMLHGNIAFLPEIHYRGTKALDANRDMVMPKNVMSFEAYLKVIGGDVGVGGKRVLWEADEADDETISSTTSALLKFLKYFNNQLRSKQSLAGPESLYDITQLFGAFLLGKNTHFQKRVEDHICAKCKEREDKGKNSTKIRAEYNKFRNKLFDFSELRKTDDVIADWNAIVHKFLHPLEPDVYNIQGMLYCKDHNTLRDIIQKMVDSLKDVSFAHNIGDHLGVLYEHFTNTYMRTSKQLGQYFTPHKLVRATIALLPKDMQLPDDVSVYDPSMGTGCFLTSFASALQQIHPNKTVHIQGNEIHQLTYSLARMALSLCCEDAPITTQRKNTLISMEWDKQHDVILSNPPFALKNKYAIRKKNTAIDFHTDESSRMLDYCKEFYDKTTEEKYANVDNPNNKSTQQLCVEEGEQEFYEKYPFNCSQDVTLGMFVTHCVKKTKVGGYGAIVVPVGTRLCSGTEKGALALRKWMVDETDVFQIMEVPKGVFVTAAVSTVVLFYKRGTPTKETRFIHINRECTRVEELFTVSRADMDEQHWQFEAGVYREEEESEVHYGIPMVALGEVCTFKNGKNLTKAEFVAGDVPVIGGGKKPTGMHNENNREANTILVSSSGSYAGFVNRYSTPIWASDCFSVHTKDTSKLNEDFLLMVLKKEQERIYDIRPANAGQPHFYAKQFDDFKIPLPPLHIQTQIVNDITPLDALRTHLQTVIDTHKHRQKMYLRSMLRLHGGSCGKVGLGEVLQKTGAGKTNSTSISNSGEVPFYGCTAVVPSGTHHSYDFDDDQYFLFAKSGGNAKSKVGENLGIGKFHLVSGKTAGNIAVFQYKIRQTRIATTSYQYLDFVLKYLRADIQELAKYTTGNGNINLPEMHETIKIPLPPLHLQTQWATYLQTIQTSIDDCTQALANLEQERNDILQSYLMAPPEPSTEMVVFDEEKQVVDDAIATVQEQPQEQQQSPQQTTSSFTPTTPEEKKAHAYLTKHNLTHIVDWHTRTIQGVAFSALQDITDFRTGDGRVFRQTLKEVDTKKLKRVVELVGKCVVSSV